MSRFAFFQLAVVATSIKLLLAPTYRSTDFEVHRNWLAITHSLPLDQWYTDSTSEWTLDYPPLFAWFEWGLSQLAAFMDPGMLVVRNLNYDSPETVLFQRLSVVATDLALISAAYVLCSRVKSQPSAAALFFLLVCNAGLLLVDHVHFQYNGLLLGLLMWSVALMQRGSDLAAGALFAVVFNMKHLLAYAGPVYFFHILRHYCTGRAAPLRFAAMGAAVAAVCAASFGPFIARGQLQQVLGRLFPFGRGLCHSYWAANFWALYSAADKVLAAVLPRLGLQLAEGSGTANMAGGLVGVSRFAALPQAGPRATLVLTLLALAPCCTALARRPRPAEFGRAVAYAFLCGFMFGYHVHEKAVLLALLPLALDALASPQRAGRFLLLSAAGQYALLPLLFRPQEYLPKIAIVAVYQLVATVALARVHGCSAMALSTASGSEVSAGPKGTASRRRQLLSIPQMLYMCGLLALELYCSWLHGPLLGSRLPFLPLLLTSCYCALGIAWVWLDMAAEYAAAAMGFAPAS